MLQEYFTFSLCKYLLGAYMCGLPHAADGKLAFNFVNKLNRSMK